MNSPLASEKQPRILFIVCCVIFVVTIVWFYFKKNQTITLFSSFTGNAAPSKILLTKATDSNLNNNPAQVHLQKGLHFHQQSQLDQAIQEYQQTIDENQIRTYALAYYNLGVAFYQQGKIEQAISSYIRAIMLNPSHSDAHYNLGYLYAYSTKQSDLALEQFQKTIEMSANYIQAYYEIGNLYEAAGQLTEAKSFWNQAISLNSQYQPALSKLNQTSK